MRRFSSFTVDRIRCKDCDAVFEIDEDLVSGSELLPATDVKRAVVLVYVPKVCPECKNLKAVPP